ncbi:MAG: Gfo/Idh/MocA family oxidoreductase [Cyclobacteriaceae bacterium]|nr:Gfo/Idh/MocA family oxidoreductase [Cyclobacteriaceae bacterium]UYN88579.1 MAG: Gfo/Idh/MocA family oxidoreductase [Cyclobacteriaceae bacterium]
MVSTIKFAVVGFGHIGKRHATIINEFPGAELVAIVDIDTKQQQHQLYPSQVPFFASVQSMFDALKNIDVVCVCTPNGLHVEHALLALDNRCHVVIEKPMGLSRASCERVVEKSLQVARHVFVVKQNRYSPPSKWLKQIVSDGTLGDVLMVQVNCYWNRDNRYYKKGSWKGSLALDGGTLFTQFSHFIDIMFWVFGDVKNIHAALKDFNHQDSTEFEDSGIVHFEFVNGGLGCINFSTSVWDTNMESSIAVVGTKGSVKVGGQYMNEIEYCHIQDYVMPDLPETNPPNDYGPFKGSAANHHYVFENVINTLKGNDTITANALEGMKVVDIIERIYQFRRKNE